MAVTYRKPVDDDVPWDQRLANYASNKNAGLSEYQRALEVYRGKSAAGDTAGAEAAKKWSDQVNTAIGGIGNSRTSQVNNTLDTIGQKVNAQPFQFKQTAAPFQYNAQADQSYQAALRQAQAGAQTATNNAMVGLGARGIGNSSVAVDRANQIQQKAIGNVNDTILPQLMQQAYARYQDQINNDYRTQLANYQAQQDQLGNLNKYAGTLSDLEQRDLDNQQRTADNAFRDSQAAQQQKQANWNAYLQSVGLTGDLGTGPKSDYSLLGDNSGNLSLDGRQFQQSKAVQDAGLTGMYNGAPTMDRENMLFNQSAENRRIGLSAASQGNSVSNARINQLMDVWQATGQAPAGLESLGVQPGTSLKDKAPSVSEKNKMENESKGMISALENGDLTVAQARETIKNDAEYGWYSADEVAYLNALLDKYTKKSTPTAGQTANTLMNPLGALQRR